MRRSIKVNVSAAPVHDIAKIEQVFAKLGQEPGSGLIASSDPFIILQRDAILRSTKMHRVPTISSYRQFVLEGKDCLFIGVKLTHANVLGIAESAPELEVRLVNSRLCTGQQPTKLLVPPVALMQR